MNKVVNTKKMLIGYVVEPDKNNKKGSYIRFNKIAGMGHRMILFENPKPIDSKVKEFLTGVEFDLVRTIGPMRFGFAKDISSCVVFEDSKYPSSAFLEDYINKHSNIDEYREELETLKEKLKGQKERAIQASKTEEQLKKERMEQARIEEKERKEELLNKIVDMRTAYVNNTKKI